MNTTSFQPISIATVQVGVFTIRTVHTLNDNMYIFGYLDQQYDRAIFERVYFSNLYRMYNMTNDASITFIEITNSTYQLINKDIVTGLSISSLNFVTSSLPNEITSITISSASSSVVSDVSDKYLDTVSFSTISGYNHSEAIDMPCTIDGTTAISYSLIQNGAQSVPSFASYDDSTFTLTTSEPSVTADTVYTLKIQASLINETLEREVYITVLACQVTD